MANGGAKPRSEFDVDVATNVMESGLLRVLTRQSSVSAAEETIETRLPPPADNTEFVAVPLPPPAPRVSLVRVALAVAIVVLVADGAMFAFHQRTTPPPAPSPPLLPTYMVLPSEPPPLAPPAQPATEVAQTATAVATAAPLITVGPEAIRPRGRHHRRARSR